MRPATYSLRLSRGRSAQLAGWLPVVNTRLVRATVAQPVDLIAADRAAMGALPPIAPATGTTSRVRLGRDYHVRTVGNDYSVDPSVGRFVDLVAGLDRGLDVGAEQIKAGLATSRTTAETTAAPTRAKRPTSRSTWQRRSPAG